MVVVVYIEKMHRVELTSPLVDDEYKYTTPLNTNNKHNYLCAVNCTVGLLTMIVCLLSAWEISCSIVYFQNQGRLNTIGGGLSSALSDFHDVRNSLDSLNVNIKDVANNLYVLCEVVDVFIPKKYNVTCSKARFINSQSDFELNPVLITELEHLQNG